MLAAVEGTECVAIDAFENELAKPHIKSVAFPTCNEIFLTMGNSEESPLHEFTTCADMVSKVHAE